MPPINEKISLISFAESQYNGLFTVIKKFLEDSVPFLEQSIGNINNLN